MPKADRIGLVVVTAALLAIVAIVMMVLGNQHDERLADIRQQGISLVRVLSGVPFEHLLPGGEQQGVVQVIRHRTTDQEFAYVSIVSPDILQLLARYQSGSNSRSFTDTIRFNLDVAAERAIATKTYPLFSPRNPSNAVGTLIIFRDETQEALARQARSDFVAHLAHEFKAPLNVLGMYSESLLTEAGKKPDFRVEAANVIAVEVDRLGSLITGLLSMTQIENGSLSPARSLVRLRDVAAAAFEEARHSTRHEGITFEFDAPREMSPVFVDTDLIRIAISNLLSNAVKYNKENGTVRLTIAETDDAIQIRVADSGMGIDEHEEARIFEKFFRSPNDRVQAIGGHGLGLTLTKQIVELHHGSLSLNHDTEEGAEFIINLWKEATAVKQAI